MALFSDDWSEYNGIDKVNVEEVMRMNIEMNTGHTGQTRKNSRANGRKGFTLVELIVVLVILSIVSAVAIPAFMGYIDKSRDEEFLASAEEAFNAAQTSLTELYNEGGNRLTIKRRINAMKMAGIDENATLDVWTANVLEDGGTVAIAENIAAYTITYAYYTDGSGRYAIYNGSKWSVYGSEDDIPQEYKTAIASEDRKLKMWPFTTASAEGGQGEGQDPSGQQGTGTDDYDYNDSAYQGDKDPGSDDYQWVEGDSVEMIVKLHSFLDVDDDEVVHNGLYYKASDSDEDVSLAPVSFKFSMEGDLLDCEWKKADKIVGTSRDYTISLGEIGFKVVGGILVDGKYDLRSLKWSLSPSSSTGYTFSEITSNVDLLSKIFKGQIKNLYPMVEKDIIEKTVVFKTNNTDTFFFGSIDAPESSRTVTFRKYNNTWDDTYSENSDIERTNIESVLRNSQLHLAENCNRNDWAREIAGGYETDDEGKIKTYSSASPEAMWNLVFAQENKDEDLVMVANVSARRNIYLFSGNSAHFHLFSLNKDSNKLSLYIDISELDGNIAADNFDSYLTSKIVTNNGYRHDGWISRDEETTFAVSDDLADIKAYAFTGAETEYYIDAVVNQASRAKFVGRTDGASNTVDGYKGKWNFVGQMRYLANEQKSNGNFKSLERLTYKQGIEFLASYNLLGNIIDATSLSTATNIEDYLAEDRSSNQHYKEVSPNKSVTITSDYGSHFGSWSGSIKKMFILWDGRDTKYDLPIFAFNIVNGSQLRVYYFTQEPYPELVGQFHGLFDKYAGVDLKYAGLETWNTSSCTDMYQMFLNNSGLKAGDVDFTKWDFSNVTRMARMFEGCTGITSIDLSGINVASCTNVEYLFTGCTSLDTVTLTGSSFGVCTEFKYMFNNCTSLKIVILNKCSIPAATSISSMLSGNSSIEYFYAKGLSAPNVTSMRQMFKGRTTLKGAYFQNYDDEHVTDFSGCQNISEMFNGCTALEEFSLKGADLSGCTNVSSFMYNCGTADNPMKSVVFDYCDMSGYTGALPNNMLSFYMKNFSGKYWDIRNATSTAYLFGGASVNGHTIYNMGEQLTVDNRRKIEFVDLSYADMRNVTDMSFMFANCINLNKAIFEGADLSSVKTMLRFCWHCISLKTLDLRSGNESFKPVDISYICDFCPEMDDLKIGDNFDTSNVTTVRNCFYNCRSLTDAHKYFESWDYTNVTDAYHMLFGARFSNVVFRDKNMNKLTTVKEMFTQCIIPKVSFINCSMNSLNDVTNMFSKSSALQEVCFDGTSMNNPGGISGVSSMFKECTGLTKFSGVGWTISYDGNANTNLSQLFQNCTALKNVYLKNANLKSVNKLSGMFTSCTSLENVYADGLDIRSVASLESLFNTCTALKVVSMKGVRLDSCTSMKLMFKADYNLQKVFFEADAGTQDNTEDPPTFKKCNCTEMFNGANALEQVEINVNMKPSTVEYMFYQAHALKGVDLSNWDFSETTSFKNMFRDCPSLGMDTGSVTFGTNTILKKVTTFEGMLYDCSSLTDEKLVSMISNWNLNGSSINFSNANNVNKLINENTTLVTQVNTCVLANDKTYQIGPYSNNSGRYLKIVNQ